MRAMVVVEREKKRNEGRAAVVLLFVRGGGGSECWGGRIENRGSTGVSSVDERVCEW